MWSDESTFYLFAPNNDRVWRPINSSPCNPRYTKPMIKHPPSVKVWGCMSSAGRGGLFFLPPNVKINAERHRGVLEDHLLPFMHIRNCSPFMQDGAPCHTSRLVTTWLQQQNINTLQWPPNSPDLNPIENLWGIMKERVAAAKPTTLASLKEEIRRSWVAISPQLCQNLVASMPTRVDSVIQNKGYPCKY